MTAAITTWRIFGLTSGWPDRTRETEDIATPARSATSRMPGRVEPRACVSGSCTEATLPGSTAKSRAEVDTRHPWCNRGRLPDPFPGEPLTSPPPAPTELRPALDGGALTIETIEVTPIVVPLEKEYRGSYYRMNNRATVL